jgi:thiamine biosynthesis lipoprotein
LADKQNRVPNQEEIDALLPHLGMPLLEVDTANQRLRKKDPKLKIDVSPIAQAYSAGLVARRLEALGIDNYWVDIGGDILLKGHQANGHHWWVSMGTPKPLSMELQQIVDNREQKGVAIMKAESHRNPQQAGGEIHSLNLNPKTGWPVTNNLQSVTVMHVDPAWASAWNNALLCVGEREAARIADTEHLKALLVYRDAHEFDEYISKAFVAAQ